MQPGGSSSVNGTAAAGGSADKITKDEVELYDRQIRLWGMDAQNRSVWGMEERMNADKWAMIALQTARLVCACVRPVWFGCRSGEESDALRAKVAHNHGRQNGGRRGQNGQFPHRCKRSKWNECESAHFL